MILDNIEDVYSNNLFALHELVLNELGSYVFVKNRQGEYLYANQLTLKLFGTTLEELKGKTDHDFFQDELLADILHSDQMVFDTKQPFISEERAQAKFDTKVRVYRAIKKPILSTQTGEVIGLIGVSTEITDIVELREQLHTLANTDDLTQLYNRRKLWREACNEFTLAQRDHYPISCIAIDIDNFKLVNDTYGHQRGDDVIWQLAEIARKHTRHGDACGRIGGEEFLIVLHKANAHEAFQVADRLRKEFYAYAFFDNGAHFSISCGISEIAGNDADFFEIYRRSDKALYKAKLAGRNQCATFQET
ncbi:MULTISPECIES: sensor domain-containing diguanylate cyclase [unclassified Vibrio]|uniref:sensor domain-containing diguanylate cyclase n=1 Tax=unclassified Vibrio TaxID=2614977 RepID=UPI000B8EB129|nr:MULTISPECIES: GGDEF domain-containing protein [unclassified Vibrio]NAW89780.1 diguanylate cyclase [Vibrio sp. V24_P1S3T111]OXX19665.1 diguanylate cyclase [Vibrio sp. V05_P4A8T149]OXX25072.1 diguanylate cyclase [Vibrio sp. V06_P1A73T115]OXX31194.1 diguanylate cyclase [Vibrio sp. V04_P4A5T148]OXX31392.1 diguanylate cyclase [Vibrio sp. V14_P6S14T42]